jgi:hypothetical protein
VSTNWRLTLRDPWQIIGTSLASVSIPSVCGYPGPFSPYSALFLSYCASLSYCSSSDTCAAPGVAPDADDTAKALLFLLQLNHPVDVKAMLSYFSSKGGHLVTYLGERNPSFSANCNVLMTLLHLKSPGSVATEICSITKFLCNSWWQGSFSDKWVGEKPRNLYIADPS